MAEDDSEKAWHLDRKVPLALIAAIAIQTGAAIWWAAGQNARVDQLEKQVTPVTTLAEKTIRLETRIESIVDTLREIKGLLRDRRTETPQP